MGSIILQAPVLYVKEIRLHQEERANALIVLKDAQLVLEIQQPVLLVHQTMDSIILQAPVIYVKEIKLHQEEQVSAQIAPLVVQLVLETQQYVIHACQATALITLQILALNVLVIKLLQEDKAPARHALQDVAHAQIIQPVQAATPNMDLIMESALFVSTIKHLLVIPVSA
jgi:hypothetical protein